MKKSFQLRNLSSRHVIYRRWSYAGWFSGLNLKHGLAMSSALEVQDKTFTDYHYELLLLTKKVFGGNYAFCEQEFNFIGKEKKDETGLTCTRAYSKSGFDEYLEKHKNKNVWETKVAYIDLVAQAFRTYLYKFSLKDKIIFNGFNIKNDYIWMTYKIQ